MPFLQIIILFATSMLWAQELPAEQQSGADKRRELLGNVNISKVNSMDEVKGSYKSPKKAMFMSLLLPGSGQMYVGGQSRYIRGTFYLAEEIALIFGLYYHSIYKYDKQVKNYREFADSNFSIYKYEKAMFDIYKSIESPAYEGNLEKIYGTGREDYCKALFRDHYENCKNNFGKNINANDNQSILNSTIFYQTIANENFVLGWKDVEPSPYNIGTYLSQDEPKNIPPPQLGTSKYYYDYVAMRKKATNLADRQAIFLGAIILNHIVSAIDAALSASVHNSSLYEEKLSFLDRIRLGSDFHTGENFKVGAGLGLSF